MSHLPESRKEEDGDFGVREGEGRHCMLGGRWVVAAVLDNSTIMGALLDYAAA